MLTLCRKHAIRDEREFIFVFCQLYVVQKTFATHTRFTQNVIDLRHFDKIRNGFSLIYAQMTAFKKLRQLNIYCCYMYFMKTGHEYDCCVFISRECRCCY